MIDKALLRKHADLVKEGMQKRACEVDIDYILQLDREWVSKKRVLETLRHERKKISQSNRLLCEERRGDKTTKGISEARAIAKKIKESKREIDVEKFIEEAKKILAVDEAFTDHILKFSKALVKLSNNEDILRNHLKIVENLSSLKLVKIEDLYLLAGD